MDKEKNGAEESMEDNDDDEGPPPGWHSIPPPSDPFEEKPASPPLPPPPPTTTTPPTAPLLGPHSEMAQMVCGSCQRLLSYGKGAKHVKCSCCETVNFVLEAHQVGLVSCGNCPLLLMYPYGSSSSVRCSSCQSVTEIGEHNQRPPWSVIQGYHPPPSSNPVQ